MTTKNIAKIMLDNAYSSGVYSVIFIDDKKI